MGVDAELSRKVEFCYCGVQAQQNSLEGVTGLTVTRIRVRLTAVKPGWKHV